MKTNFCASVYVYLQRITFLCKIILACVLISEKNKFIDYFSRKQVKLTSHIGISYNIPQ